MAAEPPATTTSQGDQAIDRRGARRRRSAGWAAAGTVAVGLIAASLALPITPSSATAAAAPDPLLVVDVESLSVEEQLTFASLQSTATHLASTWWACAVPRTSTWTRPPRTGSPTSSMDRSSG